MLIWRIKMLTQNYEKSLNQNYKTEECLQCVYVRSTCNGRINFLSIYALIDFSEGPFLLHSAPFWTNLFISEGPFFFKSRQKKKKNRKTSDSLFVNFTRINDFFTQRSHTFHQNFLRPKKKRDNVTRARGIMFGILRNLHQSQLESCRFQLVYPRNSVTSEQQNAIKLRNNYRRVIN